MVWHGLHKLAGYMGFLWVNGFSFFHCVASPFHSFVISPPQVWILQIWSGSGAVIRPLPDLKLPLSPDSADFLQESSNQGHDSRLGNISLCPCHCALWADWAGRVLLPLAASGCMRAAMKCTPYSSNTQATCYTEKAKSAQHTQEPTRQVIKGIKEAGHNHKKEHVKK